MSDVIIHGHPLSPYAWTARMACAEKGVAFEARTADTASPAHRAMHPFGKIPVLQHGEIVVYETLAIGHYIDRAFDGPPLQPADVMGQTDMLRWISIVNGYCFAVMNGLIKARFAGLQAGGQADEETIRSFREPLARQVGLIEATLSEWPFLAGDVFSLADAFLYPQLCYAAQTPEGVEALAPAPATRAWLATLEARPAVRAGGPFGGA
jgi:glutathione S-transferase